MALSSDLRSALEKAVIAARDAAEEASRAALGVLAVGAARVPDHFDDESKRLRVALRADARQLGGFELLVEECAYEQWHRMLFARFLAENDLLVHPKHGVPVTLDECEEIAHTRGGTDLWLVASEFASAMLPGIFRSDDPVLQLTLAPEGQHRLEEILAGIPREVFTSEDGLGWVYQYWQSKKKREVNASERKIGGADIAPVTQLFTENYMVRFLLENTLGAWWASRHPESLLLKEWEYLRYNDDGQPAAGSFPGWPESVAEVTVMDPCCGSGHFLVVAFEMLREMRMEADGLSAADAGEAVLRDNLFGLELDPRCTQIAAFALALQAWKAGGYRELPIPSIACSGISAKGRLEDWKKLAGGDERLERAIEGLHELFAEAGDLGSLMDPLKDEGAGLLAARFSEVTPLLEQALRRERAGDPTAAIFGSAVAGAVRTVRFLTRRYTLVATNPPFLGSGKQAPRLRAFCEANHPLTKADLATCFLERCLSFVDVGGGVSIVSTDALLFIKTYRGFREQVLREHSLRLIAALGPRAFRAISGEVSRVALVELSRVNPTNLETFLAVDLRSEKSVDLKSVGLRTRKLVRLKQFDQSRNPDSRIIISADASIGLELSNHADSYWGHGTGDSMRFVRVFWELPELGSAWSPLQSSVRTTRPYGGREQVVLWEDGRGALVRLAEELRRTPGHHGIRPFRGSEAWRRRGIAVSLAGSLPCTLYTGEIFDAGVAALIPKDEEDVAALWAYCNSGEFAAEVRKLDAKLSVMNRSLVKVRVDLTHWRREADRHFPHGVSTPTSDDPTQWLFSGHPRDTLIPLQVGVARLVGYGWPRQTGSDFPGCPNIDDDGLQDLIDEDGIVCVAPVRGERPAAERLRALLAVAFDGAWSPGKEADLLADASYTGGSLEQWLRDGFFEQHCELFSQRPFVWQIWDGRKDGFSALVNYHRLDRANLEKLTYTYLGEWIRQQHDAAATGAAGADLRLAAAQELQKKLKLILEGEPPYDIFVRWKSILEQPLGWDPDLNDGVRLNIRPFVTAGVLRKNPNIKWGKDRGKDPDSSPWYPVFKGDRMNDHPLTLAEKRAAREAAARRVAVS
jgi:hypothetical protein